MPPTVSFTLFDGKWDMPPRTMLAQKSSYGSTTARSRIRHVVETSMYSTHCRTGWDAHQRLSASDPVLEMRLLHDFGVSDLSKAFAEENIIIPFAKKSALK